MLNLSLWANWCHLDEICSSMNSTRKMTEWPALLPWIPLWRWRRDVSKGHGEEWFGGIQPVLAVFLPSAQTFIDITSQPSEKPTSNLERKRDQTKLKAGKISTGQDVSHCRVENDQFGNKGKKSRTVYTCFFSPHLIITCFPWPIPKR